MFEKAILNQDFLETNLPGQGELNKYNFVKW